MQHYKIDWLLSSAPTYENISLSVHLLQYSLSSGIGHFLHDQVERHNYVQFFMIIPQSRNCTLVGNSHISFRLLLWDARTFTHLVGHLNSCNPLSFMLEHNLLVSFSRTSRHTFRVTFEPLCSIMLMLLVSCHAVLCHPGSYLYLACGAGSC
jgi:hypothetical protein